MKRNRGRLGSWWAGIGRHQRLQWAVLSAFAAAVVMSSALLLSAGRLANDSTNNERQSRDWLMLQGDIGQVGLVLEGYDGSQSAREALAAKASELSVTVAAMESSPDSGWSAELRSVVPTAIALSNSSLTGVNADAKGSEIAQHLERIGVQISTDARRLAQDSHSSLISWFKWVIAVALIGMALLALSVWKAILPLNESIRRSLIKLESWTTIAARESERRKLSAQLTDGLDAAISEGQAYSVIERTLREITTDNKVEVLMADSSNAHMGSAVVHPDTGSPGCDVVSPWSCPAVRRGSTLAFADSTSIRACPHLAKRSDSCSAVCSPLVFMGEPIGVVHATGPVGTKPPIELIEDLSALASEGSTRLGTIRGFARAEMQASTDVLTGLSNRRATEERVARLVAGSRVGALALVEIGGLVELNSRLGKEGGDHALRLFADTVRESIRADDWCGRWAGAQIVIVLDGMSAVGTQKRLATIQERVVELFGSVDMEELTVRFGVADSAGVVDTKTIIAAAGAALDAAKNDACEPVDDCPTGLMQDQTLTPERAGA